MGSLSLTPWNPRKPRPTVLEQNNFHFQSRRKTKKKKNMISVTPMARLFGPAIFEASKLKVLFLGVDGKKHPGNLPRTYTLTHCDVSSKLTLAISQSINNSQLQGWNNRFFRDEVVAEWKRVREKMSLHVHCHVSGGHFILNLCARLRYYIFSKELPVVLKAFAHGDGSLFTNYPELEEALVWVYFHSNIPEFNKVECLGPLKEAAAPSMSALGAGASHEDVEKRTCGLDSPPQPCQGTCECCFPTSSLYNKFSSDNDGTHHHGGFQNQGVQQP